LAARPSRYACESITVRGEKIHRNDPEWQEDCVSGGVANPGVLPTDDTADATPVGAFVTDKSWPNSAREC
jgi:hypothetical protein